jgi:hypothetical protein
MYYDAHIDFPDHATILRRANAERGAHLSRLFSAAFRRIASLFGGSTGSEAADREIRALNDDVINDAGLTVAQVNRARRHDDTARRTANNNLPLGVPGPRAAA